jgi:hypothetical protein
MMTNCFFKGEKYRKEFRKFLYIMFKDKEAFVCGLLGPDVFNGNWAAKLNLDVAWVC